MGNVKTVNMAQNLPKIYKTPQNMEWWIEHRVLYWVNVSEKFLCITPIFSGGKTTFMLNPAFKARHKSPSIFNSKGFTLRK